MSTKDALLKKKHMDHFSRMAIEACEGMFGVKFKVKETAVLNTTIDIKHPLVCTVESIGSNVFSFFIAFQESTAISLSGVQKEFYEALENNEKKRVMSMITELGNVIIGSTQGSLEKEYGALTLGLPSFWKISSIFDYALPAINNFSVTLSSKIGVIQLILSFDFRELQIATQNRRLAEEATVDELTGLLNVRQYNYDIKMFVEKGNDGIGFSMLVVDVDHFKQLNDTHGHKYGDKVLKTVADTISNSIRSNDKCYRFGGDEFIIILSGAKPEHAAMTAKRICKNYAPHMNKMNQSSLSIGMATFVTGMTGEELFKLADVAMYSSKEIEGNSFMHSDDIEEAFK